VHAVEKIPDELSPGSVAKDDDVSPSYGEFSITGIMWKWSRKPFV